MNTEEGAEGQIAELLATISHELRGPLAAIKGYAETLLRHQDRLAIDEQRDFLQAISDSSSRLERLIRRVLLLSQLEQGLRSLRKAPLALVPLLQGLIRSYEQQLPQQYFVLQIQPPDCISSEGNGESYSVQADQPCLRQAFVELLDNAIKYAPEGSAVKVEVQTIPRVASVQDEPCAWIEVLIHDEGPGIPAEHHAAIFGRFARLDTSLTRPVDGLGVGLALCQRIIKMHGGTIQVMSELGGGTTFSIRLPVETDRPADFE